MSKTFLLAACAALAACGSQPTPTAPASGVQTVATNSVADLRMTGGH